MTVPSESLLHDKEKYFWIPSNDATEPELNLPDIIALSPFNSYTLVWCKTPSFYSSQPVSFLGTPTVFTNVSSTFIMPNLDLAAMILPLQKNWCSAFVTAFSSLSGQTVTTYSVVESANVTSQKTEPEEARKELRNLLGEADDKIFEDGLETEFSKQLLSFVRRYKNDAIDVLAEFILSENVNPEIASEALRWLGRIYDPTTHQSRLWLIGRSLRLWWPQIRDAATLALSSLADPQAIPLIEAAIEAERIQELREDMKLALLELQGNH